MHIDIIEYFFILTNKSITLNFLYIFYAHLIFQKIGFLSNQFSVTYI